MTDRRDLEASLAEMDRKLRELQRELALVSGPSAPPSESAAPEPEPKPDPVAGVIEEAAARVGELGRRIDDLTGLREDLDRATQALRADYRARAAAPPPPQEVTVDVGPFPDIATLSAFEQALAAVEGVQDAVVRSFEGNRAIVDLRVLAGVELEATLAAQLPFPVDVSGSQAGGLTLHLRSSQ